MLAPTIASSSRPFPSAHEENPREPDQWLRRRRVPIANRERYLQHCTGTAANPMPFDGKRMICGGFASLLDTAG